MQMNNIIVINRKERREKKELLQQKLKKEEYVASIKEKIKTDIIFLKIYVKPPYVGQLF